MKHPAAVLLSLLALVAGCSDTTSSGDVEVPETYAYESRFEAGASSVSYSGQIARHALIHDLTGYIKGLSDAIDSAAFMPAEGDVVAALDFYFRFDGDSNGGQSHGVSTEPAALQSSYDDISTGKDLFGKLAGNDSVTDHKDWSTEIRGWSDGSIAESGAITSPTSLIDAFFWTLEQNAVGRANGTLRTGPGGTTLPVYVTESGLDLAQLTQKFLLGALAFSQAADDYLDSDTPDKGLLSNNTEADDGAPYTALEHAWDEGFGYFGAARDYGDYSDDEIATRGYNDTNGDGSIDLTSEYNWGASTNAAKRDLGASAPTDFTGDAWSAFRRGRAIITAAKGPLSDDEMADLMAARDQAIAAWEDALAATVVHYINDTLAVMAQFDTEDYDFLEHAKVWSELKGFALAFQFNPRSPLSDTDFVAFHNLVGDAPVLPTASPSEVDAYRTALIEARALLGDAYGFDPANLGDNQGQGGW